jgi:nucleoside-diphosphate-sugar epimerase
MRSETEKILVIGASGQIGSDLTTELRNRYGGENVFATDLKEPSRDILESGPFKILDALDEKGLFSFTKENNISQVYHLAAVLSGNAEKNPVRAWDINMESLLLILEIAKEQKIAKIFWPSSIAVFGSTTPRINTPQLTVMEPNTVYGISKLAGERWCGYFNVKYNMAIRSLRFPGLISYKTEAGGGTTDYAVEIFYAAVRDKKYECFLHKDTRLPMMFMPDGIKATIDIMEAEDKNLTISSSYNISAISFTPEELANEIKKHIPEFEITYKPDFRQKIAESWPESIDDSTARKDWGWKHKYDLSSMTGIMLKEIGKKLSLIDK